MAARNLNMNIDDVEGQRQLLPEESSFTDAAAAIAADADEDYIQDFASSTPQPQDVARADFSSIREEGLWSDPIGDDVGYDYDYKDKEPQFEGSTFDDGDDIHAIKRIYSIDNTETTQSTSDREEAKRELPDDTFTFLIYTDVISKPFVLGVMVFLFQVGIYAVLFYNIYDRDNKKNRFGFPFNVDVSVRISEVLAIFISIITQEDIRKAISLYRGGYDDQTAGGLSKVFQGATRWKWWLSILLSATEGMLGLIITFLLIMRSDSVLDLLLNFSAIEFVTGLDDLVFKLAREKFLGQTVKDEAKKVEEKSYYVNQRYANPENARRVSMLYFFVLGVSFLAGWGVIYRKQRRGTYLCQLIFSQFGDEIDPTLGTFTGLFYKHADATFDGKSSYRGEDISDTEKGSLLAYCEKDKRWTLSLTEDGVDSWKKWKPCVGWLAASSESTSYDLLSTTSSPWVIKTPTNREAPLTHNFLACYECSNVDNFCGEHGTCQPSGEADFDRCLCESSYFGLRCEYPQPCDEVEVNLRDEDFSKDGGGQYASKYYRLEGAATYYFPVYTSRGENQSFSNGTDFILYTGERWIMSYKNLFSGLQNFTEEKEIVQYFKDDFHGNFTNYNASYESEPIYIDEVLDGKIKASPLSVRWRSRNGLQKGYVKTEFFCSKCDKLSPCFNDGVCQSNGKDSTCDCVNEYSGSRCEIPPKNISNGHCDQNFNEEQFDYDGGDCCDNKCRSTSESTCGKEGLGYIDTGYPWPPCASNRWENSADPIRGGGQAVAISGDGKVVAVADPDLSIVRLFDKDGAEWKQRGRHIQGKSDSHFGAAISLSAESINIVGNPRTLPTVTLAVGAPKEGLVRLFTCSTSGCIQKGEDIFGGTRFGSSLSISEDGKSVAIGGAARDMISRQTATNGEVKVFALTNDTWVERGSVNLDALPLRKLSDSSSQFRLQGYYVSLSYDYLAVGTLEGELKSVKLITQVFRWNKTSDVWEPLGNDIEEKDFYDGASLETPWPHRAVVIKRNVLAIGYKSSVDVYSLNETSNAWSKRDIALATDPDDFVGWSVDLSEDANMLAVGTSVENPLPTDESIQMYKWNDTHYNALFNGVPAGPAASFSLSSDGKAVAVGLPFDFSNGNGGSTRVYNFYPESPCGNLSEVPVRISFTTDESPEETTWELQVDSEVQLRSGSLSGYKYTTFVEQICVPASSCVRFLVNDTQGDGLNPPGVYALMVNGMEAARGGDFKDFDYFNVTSCDEHDTTFPSASPKVTQTPTLLPSRRQTSLGPTVTKNPSSSPTVPQPPILLPSIRPTITQYPSSIPSKICDNESKSDLISIETTFGEEPQDSYWEIRDKGSGNIIVVDVRYNVEGQKLVRDICKPKDDCYIFKLESTNGTSALIFLNGIEIATVSTGVVKEIGNSC